MRMKIDRIADRLGGITQAKQCASESLRIVPLVGDSATEPTYRLLDDEALRHVAITEVNEEGAVPELKVINGLDAHLLLLAGQELVGAKQNRTLNTDVLLPPGREQLIPVSCVEQGRWRSTSKHFGRGIMAPSSVRGGKSMDVAASLRDSAEYRINQSAVWNDVEQVLYSRKVESRTAAMHDAFRQSEAALESLRGRFQLPAECVGIAVLDGEAFLGLDLFDRESSLQFLWKSLLDSYAMDWLNRRDARLEIANGLVADVQELLGEITNADWSRHEPPGVGVDYRLRSDRLSGSALLWEDRSIVHLQVFPLRRDRLSSHRAPRIRRPYP
jgi:hypothetical protein